MTHAKINSLRTCLSIAALAMLCDLRGSAQAQDRTFGRRSTSGTGVWVLRADADAAPSFAFAPASSGGRGNQRPTASSAIALSADGELVWAVNPDLDNVAVIRTADRRVIAKVPVGDNPQSIALSPDGRFAYVANEGSDDVTLIEVGRRDPYRFAIKGTKSITTGAAPSAVVFSPDGRRVLVANSSQDTLALLDANSHHVIDTLDLRNSDCNADDKSRHFQPRALAVSGDSRHVYVTRFLSFTRPQGAQRADYGKEGVVCRVDIDTQSRQRGGIRGLNGIRLPASDSGFPDRNGRPTGAFPNQLGSIVLRANQAYLPNIGASPSGPLRFDVDTQALVNRISDIGGQDIVQPTLNLHLGARDPEPGKQELYFSNLRAMAFTTQSGEGLAYVVSAGSDLLVKLRVAPNGALGFTVDADTTRYIDLNDPDDPATSGRNAGKNPLGIVIDEGGTTAYVLNYVSRNVSVVDLIDDAVEAVVSTEALPAPGSAEELLLVGAELFFSSRGNFVHPEGVPGSSRDRLSDKGRQNCASCHFNGLTDGVVWQFASGPRKTIAVNGTFNPRDLSQQRIMNYSAIFDEIEDADFNTRRVSGGEPLAVPRECIDVAPYSDVGQSTIDPDHGLILGAEGNFALAACVMTPFTRANQNRPQMRVQLPGSSVVIGAADALREWQRSGIVTPNRPLSAAELRAAGLAPSGGLDDQLLARGEQLFVAAGCPSCHGGGQWTKSQKDFVSPPAPGEVASEVGVPTANQAPYLHRFLTDIGSFGLNVPGSARQLPGQAAIGGIEKDTNELDAMGRDYNGDGRGNGFNTPSLLGTYSVQPYYHNGACETLRCVLNDVRHRRAGLARDAADVLSNERDRVALAAYLESIDEAAPSH